MIWDSSWWWGLKFACGLFQQYVYLILEFIICYSPWPHGTANLIYFTISVSRLFSPIKWSKFRCILCQRSYRTLKHCMENGKRDGKFVVYAGKNWTCVQSDIHFEKINCLQVMIQLCNVSLLNWRSWFSSHLSVLEMVLECTFNDLYWLIKPG